MTGQHLLIQLPLNRPQEPTLLRSVSPRKFRMCIVLNDNFSRSIQYPLTLIFRRSFNPGNLQVVRDHRQSNASSESSSAARVNRSFDFQLTHHQLIHLELVYPCQSVSAPQHAPGLQPAPCQLAAVV